MENKIISIDITPDNSAEYAANAGVMWEHNATLLKFNIDKAFVGDYRYYNGTLSQLVSEKGVDDVIFLNNIVATTGGARLAEMEDFIQ